MMEEAITYVLVVEVSRGRDGKPQWCATAVSSSSDANHQIGGGFAPTYAEAIKLLEQALAP